MLIDFGTERIPYLSLGTSPFIGAGQFGSRAVEWHRQFFHNIDAMAELMAECCRIAPPGAVHVIGYEPLVDAAALVQETHDLIVTASLTAEDPLPSLERLASLNPAVIFLHGSLVDQAVQKADQTVLFPLIDQVRSLGAFPGLASHKPLALLEWLSLQDIPEPYGLLLPINKANWGMDGPLQRILSLVSDLQQPVMAMKPLAAGRLSPNTGLRYLVEQQEIAAITVGSISIDQIRANYEIIARLWKKM
ncbi:MAG: hypothetical protein ACFFB3_17390 [Candidatus Hodarchaeota archaeon]